MPILASFFVIIGYPIVRPDTDIDEWIKLMARKKKYQEQPKQNG
jgi:hypothetical protein